MLLGYASHVPHVPYVPYVASQAISAFAAAATTAALFYCQSLQGSMAPPIPEAVMVGDGQRWSEMVGVTCCDGEAMIRHAPCQSQKCCDEIRAGSHGALCLGVLGLHCDMGNQRKLVTPWQRCRNRETREDTAHGVLLKNTYAKTLISKG